MTRIRSSVFFIFLMISCYYCKSQVTYSNPAINFTSRVDSNTFYVDYYLSAKDEIEIYKRLAVCLNCEGDFDVICTIEKYDSSKQSFELAFYPDAQRLLSIDGTYGEKIKLKNTDSETYHFSIGRKWLALGKYRFKIRFYYFFNVDKKYVETEYVYFEFR